MLRNSSSSVFAVPVIPDNFEDLPQATQDYVKRLEELSGCRISVIGTGPQRDHIISVHSLLD